MRTITAPGVEIREIDKSQYSPAMTGTNCYVMGFANKGEAYLPMEFTSRAAWINYYGEPDNEAEKYFYNACVEVLNNNGRLYCARLPYDNDSFERIIGYEYNVTNKKISDINLKNFDDSNSYNYKEITNIDKTINEIGYIESRSCPKIYDLEVIDEYRTDELKVAPGSFLIVDTTFGTYRKVAEKADRKNKKREMLGIVPVVTTAANAMLAQNLIAVENFNVKYFETIGNIFTTPRNKDNPYDPSADDPTLTNNVISASTYANTGYFNDELVTQVNTAFKQYSYNQISQRLSVETLRDVVAELNNLIYIQNNDINNDTLISELDNDEIDGILSVTSYDTIQRVVEALNETIDSFNTSYTNESEFITNSVKSVLSTLSIDINDDKTIRDLVKSIEDLYEIYYSNFNVAPLDGDDSLPDTISLQANQFFTTIEYDPELNAFKRDNLKDIGVVVFKTYCDPSEGNKIRFEPVESFVGSLYKDDKDPNTGVTKFIDTIINTNSQYINFFSNCFNEDSTKKFYTEQMDMLIMEPTATCPSLGFYKEETEEKISIPLSIYDGMNKCFEKIKDIIKLDIDIICDAGISNIGQFIQSIYGGKTAGYYDLNMTVNNTPVISMWKCENSNNVKTWKTIVQKIDTFCKNVRKDCMFITECPRPLVLAGNKKIVRPSKPSNTIDVNILPNVKYITGLNTNYGAGYMDWFEVADEFTGDFFWLPPSIKAMGVYIHTDINFNYWDAPAGLNRGMISAVDVAFSPTAKQAGSIYEKNWNYAINYPQDGIILEGQKTFQVKPSAFDRINVRRLFLRLERMSYKVARYFVYEGNTAYNRQRLVDAITPYFKEAKIGGGIYDYRIVCDESNNTPETIDRNELNVSIAIKPTKTIEFIMLNFIAGRTGSTWEELLG